MTLGVEREGYEGVNPPSFPQRALEKGEPPQAEGIASTEGTTIKSPFADSEEGGPLGGLPRSRKKQFEEQLREV